MRDDRVVYERYARGYDGDPLLNSFSIAKAMVATLVGIAVSEGRHRQPRRARWPPTGPTSRGTPYGAVDAARACSP